jgi:TonB family protein
MQKEARSGDDTTKSADSLKEESGPIAQTEATTEETPVRKETPTPRAAQSQPGQVRDQVPAEEKPIDKEIALQKDLLAEQEAEAQQVEALDSIRAGLAIADAQESGARQEENALPESKRKTDGPEIAGGRQRRAKASDVPSRAPGFISPDSILIKGKVVSAEDGEAMPGVNVIMKGTTKGTVTDITGNYQLSVPAQNTSLIFSFIGFESQEVAVADQRELTVRLTEDVSSLSEVVIVSGYGSVSDAPADKTYLAAEPQTGKSDFKEYLSKSVKYPEEAIKNKTQGKVTVRFIVDPSGQLTGFEILKGIGSGCDEELIRAIREGPSWRPAKQGERPVSDKVKVRYRFELPR